MAEKVKRNFNIESTPVRVDKTIHGRVAEYAERTGTEIKTFYDKSADQRLKKLSPKKKAPKNG